MVKRSGSPNQEAASGYIELHTVKLERGLSWDEAEKIWSENCSGEHDGFYLTQLVSTVHLHVSFCSCYGLAEIFQFVI